MKLGSNQTGPRVCNESAQTLPEGQLKSLPGTPHAVDGPCSGEAGSRGLDGRDRAFTRKTETSGLRICVRVCARTRVCFKP